ncbi:hypothetical protein ACROYT_G021166 [Oculina patagonica]
MSAASYSKEVLQALLKEIRDFKENPQWNNNFLLAQSDFNEWLRVWKMTIPEGSRISKDLFVFQKKTKGKFVDLVENEIIDLKDIKVSFEMKIKFTKEHLKTGVIQEMEHYFKEKEPHVFNEHNKQQIKQEFDRFIERAKGQIEAWSERGSGWVIERIIEAYLNVARYQPLRGGTYLPLPANLANKKAIINVRNRDNECLKWALRAALFPVTKDFEALVRKISGCELGPESKQKSYTEKTEQHEACGYAYTVVRSDEPLMKQNFKDSVKDHCHITGKYRGAAHNACNLKMRIKQNTDQIPVVFHNLRGYDAHHLMQAMSKLSQATQKEVKCVANNMEKYITFSLGGLRFIDSLNFLQGSLDSLVSAAPKESLKITKTISKRNCEKNTEFVKKSKKEQEKEIEKNAELFYKKGIYPYEYMDSWERFSETSLPVKEKFYSKLNDENITHYQYKHANNVWKTFKCENLGDYHDLYVQTDVALLADVFENFRKICLEQYGLDPANYYTSPGLSWDALLKKTRVELELLTEFEMHLFIERGLRGGISMVSKRYAIANNPYVEGFHPRLPKKYIMYYDANNLYG